MIARLSPFDNIIYSAIHYSSSGTNEDYKGVHSFMHIIYWYYVITDPLVRSCIASYSYCAYTQEVL